jgi:ubiquitin carboxyl-terminal hydrolase 8
MRSPSRPSTSRQSSGPEAGSLGSIADRMRMLKAKGLDAAPNKRISRNDLPSVPDMAPPPLAPKPQTDDLEARMAALRSPTSTAGNYGSARPSSQQIKPSHEQPAITTSRSRSASGSSQVIPPMKTGDSLRSNQQSTHIASPSFDARSIAPDGPMKEASTGGSYDNRRSSLYDAPLSAGPSRQANAQTPTMSPHHSGSESLSRQLSRQSQTMRTTEPRSSDPSSQHYESGPSGSTPSTNPAPPLPDPPTKTLSADNLHEFERAFPSLSDFSKQYEVDEPPAPMLGFEKDPDATNATTVSPTAESSRRLPTWQETAEDGDVEIDLPDVSGLPGIRDLPSVPTSRPGRSEAPAAEDGISPPSPDMNGEIKRPASTPNVATMGSYPLESDRAAAAVPPARAPLGPRPSPNGAARNGVISPPAMSFPVAKPTPGPSTTREGKEHTEKGEKLVKPKFPYSNSIDCDTLRSYFLNPAVDVLLLDVRPEEEFQKGYVGVEYEARGAKIELVWLDPNVVSREG